jgi:hypothetical protein
MVNKFLILSAAILEFLFTPFCVIRAMIKFTNALCPAYASLILLLHLGMFHSQIFDTCVRDKKERHKRIVDLANQTEFLIRLISRRGSHFSPSRLLAFLSRHLTRGEIFLCGEKQTHITKRNALSPLTFYRKTLYNFSVATNKLIGVRSICLPTILSHR